MSLQPPPLDYDYAIMRISQFLRDMLRKTGASGYVMGLSGGVDSSVALALAVRAVGKDHVRVLIMPPMQSTYPSSIKTTEERQVTYEHA